MSDVLEMPGKVEAFTFGDVEPVLDGHGLLDYLTCPPFMNRWYEPPLNWEGLARTMRAAVHHASAIQVKCNILTSTYEPHPLLSRSDFSAFVFDFLVFGNAYLEVKKAASGKVLKLAPSLAKFTRRGVKDGVYWFIQRYTQEYAFEPGSVFHLMQRDINQEVYGLPEYLAALNSIFLNESATLFRRKYYANGSHAGFILYMTDPAHSEQDVSDLRKALKDSKGPGNFRNLFVYAPAGKKDGLQIIPVSEIAARDEFMNIKNVSRDDQLAAARVPPQLMGIVPNNTSGFGDAETAAKVFAANEIVPLQNRMKELNDWLGIEVMRFTPYKLDA